MADSIGGDNLINKNLVFEVNSAHMGLVSKYELYRSLNPTYITTKQPYGKVFNYNIEYKKLLGELSNRQNVVEKERMKSAITVTPKYKRFELGARTTTPTIPKLITQMEYCGTKQSFYSLPDSIQSIGLRTRFMPNRHAELNIDFGVESLSGSPARSRDLESKLLLEALKFKTPSLPCLKINFIDFQPLGTLLVYDNYALEDEEP